jgi:hypothetical protein
MHFGDKVFRTVIPRNVRLAEAPSFGRPVLFHDKESRGALAYLALAGEMIRREEEERAQAAGSGVSAMPAEPPINSAEPSSGDQAPSDPPSAEPVAESSDTHSTETSDDLGVGHRLAPG